MNLEQAHYAFCLYKNSGYSCDVYAYENKLYRVFKITNQEIQTAMVPYIIGLSDQFAIYSSSLYFYYPYQDVISLQDWMKQKHTISQCFTLCEHLLYLLMSSSLPKQLLMSSMHVASIGIDEEQLFLFLHPDFSCLAHGHTTLTQRTARVIIAIMASAKMMKHRRYAHHSLWIKMQNKTQAKQYITLPDLYQDLHTWKCQFTLKAYDGRKIGHRILYLMIGICFALALIAICVKFHEYQSRTYDAIPYIGTETTQP